MDKFSEPLQEPELALANLDLPSWVLQDDEAQLGFCQGAKEMHSSISGGIGHASPPFITSADIPDLDLDNFDWNPDLLSDEGFFSDLKSFQVVPSNLNTCNDDLPAAPVVAADGILSSPSCVAEEPSLNPHEVDTTPVPVEPLLHWNGSIPSFVVPHEEVLSSPSSAPPVIPVTIKDAVVHREITPPQFRTVSIAAPQPKITSSPMVVIKSVPSTVLQQPREPQKVVINLKRVSISPVTSAASSSLTVTNTPGQPRTLKEVLASQDAEEQLKNMINLQSPQPTTPSIEIEESVDDTMESNKCDVEPLEYEEISIVSPHSDSFDADLSYEELTSDDGMYLLSPAGSSHDMVAFPSAIEHRQPSLQSLKAPKVSGRKARASNYSPLEKKLRKKEQNKRAALRYRQKKKGEEDSILAVLQKEEERQKILTAKFNTMQMELKVMKQLVRDIVVAKKTVL